MAKRARARLYVEDVLAAGSRLGLAAAQAHYLRNVLRLKSGDTVLLFNGRDGEWRAVIDALGRSDGAVAVESCTRAQADEPDIWLLFAPLKRAPLDFLVQKAVELGVSSLRPVLTRYTDVSRVNTDRIRANIAEAAEQCGRLTLPEIESPRRIDALLADWPAGRRLIVCAESGPAPPLQAVLMDAQPPSPDADWALLTGPEGGFAPEELDALGKLPFVTAACLGPRILRAETAALAALACWQAVLGDWRSGRD
jgi:16S rRNA (uracil1498-N3)-methyltransferase